VCFCYEVQTKIDSGKQSGLMLREMRFPSKADATLITVLRPIVKSSSLFLAEHKGYGRKTASLRHLAHKVETEKTFFRESRRATQEFRAIVLLFLVGIDVCKSLYHNKHIRK
jgi:hypothetical protein